MLDGPIYERIFPYIRPLSPTTNFPFMICPAQIVWGKLKMLYTRNQFTLCKENFLSNEEVGTEEISVREVVNKLF